MERGGASQAIAESAATLLTPDTVMIASLSPAASRMKAKERGSPYTVRVLRALAELVLNVR